MSETRTYCHECGDACGYTITQNASGEPEQEQCRTCCEFNEIVSELAAMTAERDESIRKQVIDQRQCDDMTSEAGRMASELAAITKERDAFVSQLTNDGNVVTAMVNLMGLQAELKDAVRRYERAELAADFERLNAMEAELAKVKADNEWHPASELSGDPRFVIISFNHDMYVTFYTGGSREGGYHWRELPKWPEVKP